jgi:hypothetical protein
MHHNVPNYGDLDVRAGDFSVRSGIGSQPIIRLLASLIPSSGDFHAPQTHGRTHDFGIRATFGG